MRLIVRESSQYASQFNRRKSAGFTLVDVLVSLAVIALLIGLMLPALNAVRETGRKVVCSSNIRQIGIGLATYADDFRGTIPHSRNYRKSLTDPSFRPETLMQARIAPPTNNWDGLGLLYARSYTNAAGVFYCPSHKSIHRYDAYASGWGNAPADVYLNFQYRGGTSRGESNLSKMPDRISLISDGLASAIDFNHGKGSNVIASDLSVAWFGDVARLNFPFGYDDPLSKDKLQQAWNVIDEELFK